MLEAPKSPTRSASLRFGGGLGGRRKAQLRARKDNMAKVLLIAKFEGSKRKYYTAETYEPLASFIQTDMGLPHFTKCKIHGTHVTILTRVEDSRAGVL